ncbi:MAG: hypothetical protein NT038_07425 [Euryarchaeota archaeon]|nr:hypothetical protein [Euryarchaeota archaeon]
MKTGSLLIFLTILLLTAISCRAIDISVQPAEVTITMTNAFSSENTITQVTVTNNNNQSINVTWYLEHPSPQSLIRPNRTYIENISWIHVSPPWCILSPYASAPFSLSLDIPERDELKDQHWETWVTFTPHSVNGSSLFMQEYAVRVYIDTPQNTQPLLAPSNNLFQGTQYTLLVLMFVIAAISIVLSIRLLKKNHR